MSLWCHNVVLAKFVNNTLEKQVIFLLNHITQYPLLATWYMIIHEENKQVIKIVVDLDNQAL